ncbi:hypothetical protein CRE_10817 [Caenorhabditis remanei]|uniref:Zinc finger CCCH-type with G patch domain-containing protein n=1 Tax=Caenorhabditis remanei TaxID=31234 RepID=E3M515_CAERE|nr:hypothetical protein CRE_10817 [Caenorhabditis remanei]
MSEIDDLKSQIARVGNLIEIETDEESLRDLEQAKADLEELVALLEEEKEEEAGPSEQIKEEAAVDEKGKISDGKSIRKEETDGDDDDNSPDNILGSRCMAPFVSDRSLPLHTAIIMEIESSTRVRVLFSHPTCIAMKPCSHFLSSNCRYSENCRFSHGYSVELERIEDYQEPDYSSIVEQGLVLVKGERNLWEMGRISAIDGQNVAVKLLTSGSEVSAKRGDLVPLGEVEEQEKDGSWMELKQETLGNVSVGELGKWNGGGGIGMKLMMKMGYKVGDGLGKRSDGIVHSIQARICAKNASLDEVMNRKRKVVDGKEKHKTKKIKKLNTSDESEKDIFAFINRKLEKKSERTLADVRKEKEEMAGYSAKSLGAKNLDLESEMKQLVGKQKKLRDGIRRNQNDKDTVAKMTVSLLEVDEKIASVNRKLRRVKDEVSSRNSKRKDEF